LAVAAVLKKRGTCQGCYWENAGRCYAGNPPKTAMGTSTKPAPGTCDIPPGPDPRPLPVIAEELKTIISPIVDAPPGLFVFTATVCKMRRRKTRFEPSQDIHDAYYWWFEAAPTKRIICCLIVMEATK